MPRPQKGVGQGRRSSFDVMSLFSPSDSRGDEYKNTEVEEDPSTGKATVKDTRSKLLGIGPRLGRDNASRLQSKYNLADIVANQQQGRAKDLYSFEQDADLDFASRLNPITQQGQVNTFYANQGIMPDVNTLDNTKGVYNAKRNAELLANKQQMEIANMVHPANVMTAGSVANTAFNEAADIEAFSNSLEAQRARHAGYLGTKAMPAAQASRLGVTEVGPNAVAYNSPLNRLFSPDSQDIMSGPMQTETPYGITLNGQFYPQGTSKSFTPPPRPLSNIAAKLQALRSGNAGQPAMTAPPPVQQYPQPAGPSIQQPQPQSTAGTLQPTAGPELQKLLMQLLSREAPPEQETMAQFDKKREESKGIRKTLEEDKKKQKRNY